MSREVEAEALALLRQFAAPGWSDEERLARMLELRPRPGDARIVEEHIQAAPPLICRVEHALDIRRPSDVRLQGRLAELIGNRSDALAIHVCQQQLCAVLGQSSSARGADTARGAGDKYVRVCQSVGHEKTSASYTCRWRSAAAR